MNKLKVSMRDLKAQNVVTLGVAYCALQDILSYYNANYYCTSIYGWACDGYVINQTVTVVTGYNYSRASNMDFHSLPKTLQAKFFKLNEKARKAGWTDTDKRKIKRAFEKLLNEVWEIKFKK